MDWFFPAVVGLALTQVIFYRVDSRKALRTFALLGIFYFFLFAFVQGLKIFCTLLTISFYDLPLLTLVLFLIFGRELKTFPRFERVGRFVPQFYFWTSLFISLIWFAFPFSRESFVGAFFWSFFVALLIPILSGIKERLSLSNSPEMFQGLPLFLLAAGILVLALMPWTQLLINIRPWSEAG